MADPASLVPLEYQLPPRKSWKVWKYVRRILLLIPILAIAGAAFHYRDLLKERIQTCFAQRACMSHTAPPDQVVYEWDKQRGQMLVKQNALYTIQHRSPGFQGFYYSLDGTIRSNPTWEAMGPHMEPGLGYSNVPGSDRSVVLFLHSRKSKAGTECLVLVEGDFYDFARFRASAFTPGQWGKPPTFKSRLGHASGFNEMIQAAVQVNGGMPRGFQVYAGQPDPNDESRFTIRAVMDGFEMQIVGILSDENYVSIDIPGREVIAQQLAQPRKP